MVNDKENEDEITETIAQELEIAERRKAIAEQERKRRLLSPQIPLLHEWRHLTTEDDAQLRVIRRHIASLEYMKIEDVRIPISLFSRVIAELYDHQKLCVNADELLYSLRHQLSD